MRYAPVTEALADLGGAKWAVHARGRAMAAAGRDVIELTIGEPDVPPPAVLVEAMAEAARTGRTAYSSGRGEAGLLDALADRYSARMGRAIGPDQFLCVPGTQTALYVAMQGLVGAGDEVLVADPLYATYEGVIRAAGAAMVPVPLDPAAGFRLDPAAFAARVTARTRAILLNSPHNPTGTVATRDEVRAIGTVAAAHDLWIVSDEVYEELIFDGPFASPFAEPALAERTVVVSSISKSHAAPGLRSGWIAAPAEAAARLLPVAETMLFGNQPFIADATALAVAGPSAVAGEMRRAYAARADLLAGRLAGGSLRVHRPEAGMFALVDVGGTGMDGDAYAADLLDAQGVSVMPGSAFGSVLRDWVRVALTVPDAALGAACDRMTAHAAALQSA
ncbi:pyridoxal phosphate-dependent aminotransferase [Jannaschia sp. Os4]|uniref:pyridoxal phosphate-dependent aminotransferase n=1 Tax=Jannaschia sp. Os4 TaxID=2807617 RepID=UPI0019392C20|nr:pyridoxal phosphate-dependent aminotransferase [Jannaschia sp. Os4]MBM2575705.1 pyridoxal phosphate-dependent aminotransferase [Jannaschia sp. Os4]